jgi:hypothetical protein
LLAFAHPGVVQAGDDRLIGGVGDDRLFGGTGDGTVYGDMQHGSFSAGGDDELFGGPGNDFLASGRGDDLIDGGADVDTAGFDGLLAAFSTGQSGAGFTVTEIGPATLTS